MFLETICVEKGVPQNLDEHARRMRQTANHFGFLVPQLPPIEQLINSAIKNVKAKCSIVYREDIKNMAIEVYVPKRVESLKLIHASPNYSFKFADRNELQSLLARKESCDDILIVRDGCITDTSYSNVVFLKDNQLFTPTTFLLNGTKRQKLLREDKIKEIPIHLDNLHTFERVFLINAMLDITYEVAVNVSDIE